MRRRSGGGGVVLIVVVVGHLPPVVAFVAIFKLNGLTTFMNPARASIMPSVVGRDLLTTAQGLFSTAREDRVPVRQRGRWAAARGCGCRVGASRRRRLVRVRGAVHGNRPPAGPAIPVRLGERGQSAALANVYGRGPARWLADRHRTAGRARSSLARRPDKCRLIHRTAVAGPRAASARWWGRILWSPAGSVYGRRHSGRAGCWTTGAAIRRGPHTGIRLDTVGHLWPRNSGIDLAACHDRA